MLHKLLRLYHTIRPLRLEQIIYRLRYQFIPLGKVVSDSTKLLSKSWVWSGPEFITSSLISQNTALFLNEKADISSEFVWNDPSYEKLWLYNLHYFDDLNAQRSLKRKDIQYSLVKRWVFENPAVKGNGWEPYPISLRLVNWVKWYKRAEIKDQSVIDSIALQAKALSKQLEYHILGNHLFANAKALVFSGCFLKGDEGRRYLGLGLKLLDREVPEQFLEDGGHFELSPMYHSILLWDLLDLINLAQISKESELISRLKSWEVYASKALSWLAVMTHTDDEISFFNDAAIGVSAGPDQLKQYAESLDLEISPIKSKYCLLKETGYSRISFPNYVLLFDHAEVGASYLPGHAHADTLSVELSLGKNRFFVNSGTSIYGLSDERHRQRGTAAHNTVIVDNSNSSEVWGGFRVARRAHVKNYNAQVRDGFVSVSAQHDGYLRLNSQVLHARTIEATPESITIKDDVSGKFSAAVAFYHLHPDVNISRITGNNVLLGSNGGFCISFESTTLIEIEESTYHPGFGVTTPNKRLAVHLSDGKLEVSLIIKKV